MNIDEYMRRLEAAKEAAEAKLGFEIPSEVAAEVLEYSIHKCEVIGKDDDYLPLLFENELWGYYMMMAINLRGCENSAQRVSQETVQQMVSECR